MINRLQIIVIIYYDEEHNLEKIDMLLLVEYILKQEGIRKYLKKVIILEEVKEKNKIKSIYESIWRNSKRRI